MDINTPIPAPSSPEKAGPIGYDIPRDTISRDFLRSTRTARQLSSPSATNEGFRQYLIPSTSTSPANLVNQSPRIIVSSPDDDVFAAPLGSHRSTSKSTKSSWNDIDPETGVEPKDARRTHHRSFLVAIAVAVVVLIIVIFFIALLIYS